jgi:DNA-binding transcriptional regulator YbjK
MRGEARRTALLEAAIQLIGRRGLSAVTHRSVAALAGVPAATTSYYFPSKERLVEEALRTLGERELADLRERHALLGTADLATTADALATWLLDHVAADGGAAVLAEHELQLEAARRPELRRRGAIAHEIDALAERALADLGAADPALAAVLLVSAIDGLELRLLADDTRLRDRETLRRTLGALLTSLTTPTPLPAAG